MRITNICVEISNNRRRILIVDNDANMLTMLQRVLERKGLKTETAKDLNEASHIVTKQRYDLLLIDIGQKLVDGWNSIEKLKSEHNYLLFIVTSNFDNAYSDQRCKEVGALGLLVKPFEIRDLDNALNLAFTRKNT